VTQLQRDARVRVLGELKSERVTRADRVSDVWYEVEVIVTASGFVDAESLTGNPTEAMREGEPIKPPS
jgi:hypothetical protein